MIGTLLYQDMRLQARSRFYAAYAFVCITYIVLLRLVPLDARAFILPPVLLSEAGVVGFFFAGAMLHYERSDGVLEAIAVTPLPTRWYVGARVLALTLLNTGVGLVIVLGSGVGGVRPVLLSTAAAGTGLLFALLGTAVAARFASIDRFVVLGGLMSALFSSPVFPYFGLLESGGWRVLPTDAALRLYAAGAGAAGSYAGGRLTSVLVLGVWCAGAAVLTTNWLDRYALGRRGTAA